jgi:acetyl esterase/lipase
LLSWESEGTRVAEWLAEHGIAAFVLKYRLLDTGATEADFLKALESPARPPGAAGDDKARARWNEVHEFSGADAAQAVKVVRKRAAEWGVAQDRIGLLGFSAGAFATMKAVLGGPEGRPDFAAPIYGGTISGATVPPDAPPLFILVANNDRFAQSSVEMYSAWKAADRPVELHIYAAGGHGFGMNQQGLPIDSWIERFADWMGQQGLLKRQR